MENIKTIIKKYKLLLVIFFVFLIVTISAIVIIKERERNLLINPAIYPTFIEIENYCLNYIEQELVNPQEYEKCKKLVDLWETELDKKSKGAPLTYAEEWYKYLIRLGFKLPPFRLKQKPTDAEYNQSIVERNTLLQVQREIIDQQLENQKNKIDDIINQYNSNK